MWRLLPLLLSHWLVTASYYPIHLIWTTPLDTLQPRHQAVWESYLRHHPRWPLHFYFKEGGQVPTEIQQLPDRGYNITVHWLNDHFIMNTLDCHPAGKEWLAKRKDYESGPYYYSHLTDILRFCLLWSAPGKISWP